MYARDNGRLVLQLVYAKQSFIIPSRSESYISVHYASLFDRDFFFEPVDSLLSLYTYLVDAFIIIVIVKNDTDFVVKVFRNLRLGTI